MRTFFIEANDFLATEVVAEILNIPADTLISPRGEYIEWADGSTSTKVYSVSSLDERDHPSRYEWTYVTAKDWLAEYDASR